MTYKEIVILNPDTYKSEQSLQVLRTNLADVAIESGFGPIRERINPFTLTLKYDDLGNPIVTNDELDPTIDVLNYYSSETDLKAKEKRAAEMIRDHLIKLPHGTISVWFSPQHDVDVELGRNEIPYTESRITVGYVTQAGESKFMKSYAIPASLEPQQMLLAAWRLAEFNNTKDFKLETPEDLRSTPVDLPLPHGESPWEFLSRYIETPDAWEIINSGEADNKRGEKLKAIDAIAPSVLSKILNAKSPLEQVSAMNFARTQMARAGLNIDTARLGCVHEISLGSIPSYQFSYGLVVPGGGNIMLSKEIGVRDKYGSLQFDCPHAECGKTNHRPYGQLLTNCQHCGKDVRCG